MATTQIEFEQEDKLNLPKPKESTHRTILKKFHAPNKPSTRKHKQSAEELQISPMQRMNPRLADSNIQ